jgi:hypothetical protein
LFVRIMTCAHRHKRHTNATNRHKQTTLAHRHTRKCNTQQRAHTHARTYKHARLIAPFIRRACARVRRVCACAGPSRSPGRDPRTRNRPEGALVAHYPLPASESGGRGEGGERERAERKMEQGGRGERRRDAQSRWGRPAGTESAIRARPLRFWAGPAPILTAATAGGGDRRSDGCTGWASGGP